MRARLPRRGECRGDGAHRPGSPVIRGAAVPHSHRAASVSPDAVHPLRAARPGRSPIARPGTPYQQPPVGARAEGKVRGLRGGGAGRPGEAPAAIHDDPQVATAHDGGGLRFPHSVATPRGGIRGTAGQPVRTGCLSLVSPHPAGILEGAARTQRTRAAPIFPLSLLPRVSPLHRCVGLAHVGMQTR